MSKRVVIIGLILLIIPVVLINLFSPDMIIIEERSSFSVFNIDDSILATANWGEYSIQLWDPATGRELYRIWLDDEPTQIVFHPGGHLVVVTARHSPVLRFYSTDTWQQVDTLYASEDIRNILFTPNGEVLYVIGLNRIEMWTVNPLEQTNTVNWRPERSSREDVPAGISYNGEYFAVVDNISDFSGILRILSVASLEEIYSVSFETSLLSLCWHPTENILALGGDDTILRVWNVDERREIASTQHMNGMVTSLAYSPDGRYIATGGFHNPTTIWNAQTMEAQRIFYDVSAAGYISSLSYSSNNQYLVISRIDEDTSNIDIWNNSQLVVHQEDS